MSALDEQNKAAVRDCFAHASRGDFEALHDVVSRDYTLHPAGVRGIEGLTEMVSTYRRALPDLTVTIDYQFSAGDYVATRFTIRGTHDGDLMGTPPTGREVEFTGLTMSRCSDGMIEEEWELTDTLSLLTQVGVLPGAARA